MPGHRLRVRTRLTAIFAGAYLAIASVLIATAYLIVRARLTDRSVIDPTELVGTPLDVDGAQGSPDIGADALATLERLRGGIVDDTLDALLIWLSVAAVVAGIAAIALGWYTAGRALSPVQRVTATAQGLSEQNLSDRVNYHGPADELAELARTFDNMLDRIENAMDAQRQFTAMASHELRTPLSQITAATSLARSTPDVVERDELIAIVEPAATKAAVLVDQLLELMRSRNGLHTTERIRLDELVQRAIDDHAPAARRKNLTAHVDLNPVTVEGDPVLLASMVANLMANAITHNLTDGKLEVGTSDSNAAARIQVSNSGDRVSEAALQRITEPFQRGLNNPDQLGHGLGTTIIRTIAEAHNGTVTYTARPHGGIDVEVTLPVTQTWAP